MGGGSFVEDALGNVKCATIVVGYDVCFLKKGSAQGVKLTVVRLADREVQGACVREQRSRDVEVEGCVGKDNVRCWPPSFLVAQGKCNVGVQLLQIGMRGGVYEVKFTCRVECKSKRFLKLLACLGWQPYLWDRRIDKRQNRCRHQSCIP